MDAGARLTRLETGAVNDSDEVPALSPPPRETSIPVRPGIASGSWNTSAALTKVYAAGVFPSKV